MEYGDGLKRPGRRIGGNFPKEAILGLGDLRIRSIIVPSRPNYSRQVNRIIRKVKGGLFTKWLGMAYFKELGEL